MYSVKLSLSRKARDHCMVGIRNSRKTHLSALCWSSDLAEEIGPSADYLSAKIRMGSQFQTKQAYTVKDKWRDTNPIF